MKKWFFLVIFDLLVVSCTTVQHNIPLRKPANNEVEYNLSICYDLNNIKFTKIPGIQFNAYYNAGNDFVIGYGFQMPPAILPLPTHFTVAKYINYRKDNYFLLYTSFNKLSISNSPLGELGLGYINKKNNIYQSVFAGLWHHKPKCWNCPTKQHQSKKYLKPFIKYNISASNIRLNVQNYIGLTEMNIYKFRATLRDRDQIHIPHCYIDTIIVSKTKEDLTTYKIWLIDSCYYDIADHEDWNYYTVNDNRINGYNVDKEHYVYDVDFKLELE